MARIAARYEALFVANRQGIELLGYWAIGHLHYWAIDPFTHFAIGLPVTTKIEPNRRGNENAMPAFHMPCSPKEAGKAHETWVFTFQLETYGLPVSTQFTSRPIAAMTSRLWLVVRDIQAQTFFANLFFCGVNRLQSRQ